MDTSIGTIVDPLKLSPCKQKGEKDKECKKIQTYNIKNQNI
jgi:hypothetical protein